MKKQLYKLIIFILVASSCDPDVANEGVNLPQIDFPFTIENDSSHFKLGDTLKVSAIVSNILSDGTKLSDGKASIKIGNSYSNEIPILNSSTQRRAKNEIEFKVINLEGAIYIQETTSNLYHLYSFVEEEDSMKISFYYIPLKTGTYSFDLASLFFEGKQGKTRTNPFFNINDNHGEILWQVPNMPAISPNDPSYKRYYYFAVTD